PRGGRLRGHHRRCLRPARRGRLRERRAPARGDLGEDPPDQRRGRHRDVHVPQAAQADLLVGCALSPALGVDRGDYRHLSLWHETTPDDWTPRDPLPGTTDVDVAIVGGGFTGLWTALYLAKSDPSLRIAVLESEVAGFGASGRNGGWCSA